MLYLQTFTNGLVVEEGLLPLLLHDVDFCLHHYYPIFPKAKKLEAAKEVSFLESVVEKSFLTVVALMQFCLNERRKREKKL